MGRHDLTAADLHRMLADQAERFAREILPNGKKIGNEWRVGGVDGEAGKSMGVCISGSKAGVWADFDTGEAGDMLDLIRAVDGCDLRGACERAKAMLGVPQGEPVRRPNREYRRPKRPNCSKPKSAVKDYLAGRGLSEETLEAYRIGEQGNRIVFPFMRDGELVMAKTREAKDGSSPKPTEANCEPCLFGWQVIRDNAREVIITEGEIDAMSCYEAGFPALSVPYGGGAGNKQQWIETEYENLAVFDTIYLCMDRDTAGEQAIAEIVKRLGAERIRVVTIGAPFKDANDCLRGGFGTAEFGQLILRARRMDPAELRPASDYADRVISESEQDDVPGVDLPWSKTHGRFRMRFGETVIIAGVNGHGKTEMAGNLTAGALSQCERACVASYEFLPHRWLKRFVRQCIANPDPNEKAMRDTFDWFDDRLWVVDAKGSERATKTVEVFTYAAKRYGVRFFVIDNLSKCGIADDDYQGQKEFIDRVSEFAREMDVIVLIVMHMTKGDESRPSGKMQARGSGQITDLVDSFLIVWRNKPKEAAQRTSDGSKDKEPDCKLICEKQRNGEEEPMFALWFHQPSHQFIEHPQAYARRYGKTA